MKRHLCLILALNLALGACTVWRRTEPGDLSNVPPRRLVRVWSGGTARGYHGVRIVGDSLSGVPWQHHSSCDSCRETIALARVDSMRAHVYRQEAPLMVVLGIVGATLLFAVWARSSLGSD